MIRPARLSDRQELGELWRRVHDTPDGHRRSLGLPASPPRRKRFSLGALVPSWLPLRAPSVHLVMEEEGRLLGSCQALEEPHRDDWVITELDADEGRMAAEVRYELLRALIEAGAKREAARFHAACSDVRENLELFGQLGFMAYAQEEICYRAPEGTGPGSWVRRRLTQRRAAPVSRDGATPGESLLPAGPPDAWHLFDLWTHCTPPAVARVEGYGAADWESVNHEAAVPRSSLTPLLEFGEVRSWLRPYQERAGAFVQHGLSRDGPHYLRVLVRDGVDGGAVLAHALELLGAGALAAGLLTPVRTYEAQGMRAVNAAGFESIGRVTLLVREVRAAIRQPAMVPAVH